MNPIVDALSGIMEHQVWATYAPANVRGYTGESFALGVAHANTGGVSASGALPIPAGGTSTAVDTLGVVYDGTPNTAFDQIVTALVIRNVMENLRTKAVVMNEANFLRARHVPGTKTFTYVFFADLGDAEDLLEGVPPQTEGLAWDTFSFTGGQKGKLVAITDLAELFSPFDLYRIASEKLAWNAIDTAEKQAVALLNNASVLGLGTGFTASVAAPAANIVNVSVLMKKAEVPQFPDGTYHALISPTDAAYVMSEVGELGWLDASKYANPQAVMANELGTFKGLRFIESNRVADGRTIVFGPGAFVWGDYQTIQAYRVAPGGDHADPLAQRGLLGWKGMWGMARVTFDGTPAIGPASNTGGLRFGQFNIARSV